MNQSPPTNSQSNAQVREADAIYGHEPREYRRYLNNFALVVVLVLLATSTMNLLVDPYARYELIRAPGFNERKPAAVDQVALTKTYQVIRARPQTLLLGNSRVDIGLDPESPSLPQVFTPAYNLAIPGTGVEAALFYLRHAAAHTDLKALVLGVDFMDFLTEAQAATPVAGPRLDGNGQVSQIASLQQTGNDTLTTLLSLSATLDSLNTLLSQRDSDAGGITRKGLNLASQFNKLVSSEGHYALFTAKNREYLQRLVQGPRQVFIPGTKSSSSWQALQEIVEFCTLHDIRLTLFIHPYHADVLGLFDRAQLWTEFERWKRGLTAVTGKPANPVTIWDFSAHGEITNEALPGPGDTTTKMHWYWEGGHYKRELGERMFARMFAGDDGSFGTQITPANIAEHLTLLRERKAQYAASHPDAVERITRLPE
ncbi:MAG: hypothetical protein HKN70_14425 [Gammaproteobacteria bacterium]|nr:hypothetical protein [Gammaproteobacteria bacterium]